MSEAEGSSPDGLVRSSAVVGIGTGLSRVTGLLRTAALTYALGATVVADGYNLANTTPNIVYDLILGGILSATLVPVFVDRFEHDDEDGVSAVVTVTVVVLVAITAVAVLAAPLILQIYTWNKHGPAADELERVGVPLLRLFLPQILFYGLTALATAILNARRRFAAPAYAPVLNNVVVIVVLLWFAQRAGHGPTVDRVVNDRHLLLLLGFGTTAGIVVMTLALWPSIRSAGVRVRWRFQPRDPAVRKVASLSGWTLGYVVANQIALAIALALAARRDGDVSAFTYAFVFFQLPYGLFAVSIMTTFTPDLASAASRGDFPRFSERFALGTRLITLVVLPASVGYILLARPLVAALLARGSFGGTSPIVTADVLTNFAIGLVGFSVYLFTMRAFYALHDTRTPFVLSLLQTSTYVVLAVLLHRSYGVQGIAFAYSVAYLGSAIVALLVLRRRIGRLGGTQLLSAFTRIVAATAVMAAAVWLSRAVGSDHGAGAVTRVVVGILVGTVVYAMAALALRVDDLRGLRDRLLRR